MNYEKPEVRDFGAIADHTYGGYNQGDGGGGEVAGVTLVTIPNGAGSAY